MKTKKEIVYKLSYGSEVTIPKGAPVIPADNLPADNGAGIAYWVEPWQGIDDSAESHARTYGFGVGVDDVEA